MPLPAFFILKFCALYVENLCDRLKLLLTPSRQVSALGEVSSHQPAQVLVGAAPPTTVRIRELRRQLRCDGESRVIGQLPSTILSALLP
jgi:hypothetical protein